MSKVTDRATLDRLNSNPAPVTDPQILDRLNSETGAMDQFGRQIGLTARALAGGAAQIVEPFTEPVRYLMNKALPGNPIGNIETATDEVLTSAGVPEPEGSIEQGVQSVGRFATSFAGGQGIANKVDDVVHGVLNLTKKVATSAPTTAQLKEIANGAYKAADDVGLVINPNSFRAFVKRVSGAAKNAGIDRDIHPKATAAIRRLREAVEGGEPIKLQDFEILRRVVGGARGSIDKDEARIGRIISNQLDDYLAGMGAKDIIAGDAKAASTALGIARDAWQRMGKSNVIHEAVEKAGVRAGQFTGSGFENALRTQFRQIAMNPKRMRGFSPDERAAIKKVAMGGPIDNAFRMLGKLAPTGVVSGGMGAGMGYAVGGPVGAVAVPAAGMASRRVATELTKRNVSKVDELVRNGAMPDAKGAPEWLLPWVSGAIFGVDTQGN